MDAKIIDYVVMRQRIFQYAQRIDWSMLLLLVLVLNVKLVVKVVTILVFAYINRKQLFDKTALKQRFLWFYGSMIFIALINLLILIPQATINYFFVVMTGAGNWLLCLLTALIIIRYVRKNSADRLHATLGTFFLLNAVISIIQLLLICIETGYLNPYTYQGIQQKYFINTGDFITGLSFDISTSNALINALAVVYFLSRSRLQATLLCMTALLLTVSNFTNIILLLVFLYLLFFSSTRTQKSIIVVCIFLLIIFMAKVSPQNNMYLKETYERISGNKIKKSPQHLQTSSLKDSRDAGLTDEEKKRKIALLYLDSMALEAEIDAKALPNDLTKGKPSLPKDDIHSKPFQRLKDSTVVQKTLVAFVFRQKTHIDTSLSQTKSRKVPGKLVAYQQTLNFFSEHPQYLALGAGTGNFSSKLAFRATGLQVAGGYPQRFTYINECFMDNHLALYLDYFSKDAELHSLTNSPDSVYDQLLSEYGLAGMLAFIIFYAGYFGKQRKAFPLIFIIGAAFFMGYWFEQLSIVIIFELLLLLDKKEQTSILTS